MPNHLPEVAFFGCWNSPGHFLYGAYGPQTIESFGPFIPESLDMVFCKPRFLHDSTLVCFKDYTLLAFLDNTVDRRPGSNGVFIVEGYALSKADIWREATRVFPRITTRLKDHVRLD